jgi:hypothetical protein
MKNKYLSRPDVQQYLSQFPDVTPTEKAELLKWIKAGNSPYDNDEYVCDDTGRPMDYINAMRFWKDMYEEYLADPVGFRERFLPDAEPCTQVDTGGDDDLPF